MLGCRLWAVLPLSVCSFASQANPEQVNYIINDDGDSYQWEVRTDLNSQFGYRLGGYKNDMIIKRQREYVAHSGNFSNKAATAMLDWHPFGGNFRISSGVFITDNRLHFLSEPTVDYTYPGKTIPIDRGDIPQHFTYEYAAQTIDVEYGGQRHSFAIEAGSIDIDTSDIPDEVVIKPFRIQIDREDINVTGSLRFRPVAPYFGIGWANQPESGSRFRFGFDIGLIYQGSPKLDMQLNGRIMDVHPRLTAELNERFAQETARLQDKVDKYRVLPYAAIGMSMRL